MKSKRIEENEIRCPVCDCYINLEWKDKELKEILETAFYNGYMKAEKEFLELIDNKIIYLKELDFEVAVYHMEELKQKITGKKQEKTKAIILDNNELSLSKYLEEFGDLK